MHKQHEAPAMARRRKLLRSGDTICLRETNVKHGHGVLGQLTLRLPLRQQ